MKNLGISDNIIEDVLIENNVNMDFLHNDFSEDKDIIIDFMNKNFDFKKVLVKIKNELKKELDKSENINLKFYNNEDIKEEVSKVDSWFSRKVLDKPNLFKEFIMKSNIYKNSESWFGCGEIKYENRNYYIQIVLFSEIGIINYENGFFTEYQFFEKLWGDVFFEFNRLGIFGNSKFATGLKLFLDYTKYRSYYFSGTYSESKGDSKWFESIHQKIKPIFKKHINEESIILFKQIVKKVKLNQQKKNEEFNDSKESLISNLDNDKNGLLDLVEIEDEFNQIIDKNQKVILEKSKEFNQNYTHQFIKIGNYIKEKKRNLQLIFDFMRKSENQNELKNYNEILEKEIYSYNLLVLNSLTLIVSLIDDDHIIFYDIYERFDKINIFNSNWENEISQKLTKLNQEISKLNLNLKTLMSDINKMGNRIINSFENLSHITKESTNILDKKLGEIDSTLKTNNLLTIINTYQTYKINKNTKSLK